MRILFDHNIPAGTARALTEHEVTEAIERGWHRISNGELLANAEQTGFDVFLTGTNESVTNRPCLAGASLSSL